MAISRKTLYEPLQYYHIYNRANGWEDIFLEEENYYYFLKKYAEKLNDVVKTVAYCLMPNHFHLLIQVRSTSELHHFLENKKKRLGNVKIPKTVMTKEHLNHFVVQRQLTNFLGGYVKAFNKYHQRKGSLFQQNTCRKFIGNANYLKTAIRYIHRNAAHHEFVVDFEDWTHSSYFAYLSDKPTKIPREEVLGLFGGKEAFVDFHKDRLKLGDFKNLQVFEF